MLFVHLLMAFLVVLHVIQNFQDYKHVQMLFQHQLILIIIIKLIVIKIHKVFTYLWK